jgi:CDP-diacylglycerol--glycerol-3-phosphate 3-phosphatidyltransferase
VHNGDNGPLPPFETGPIHPDDFAWLTPMNLPNSLTMSRIFCVPLLIWILSPAWPWHNPPGAQELLACGIFILASITDGVDGYLARRRGQITTMGMLLDPLADKLMVTAAFIALVEFNPRIVAAWIAVIVIGREFLVSGLRSIAASEGFTIEASDLGKLKMVTQIVAVVAAILDHRWDAWRIGWFEIPVHILAVEAIYFMVVVSIISAADYFLGFWKKIDHASAARRTRASFVLSRRKNISPAK